MGQYANTVNAYAESAARAQVYTMQNRLQSYGQTAYMFNVSTAKFRKDIEAKKIAYVARFEKDRAAYLQKELARLPA